MVITCPIHGDFHKQANSHLQGSKCPECAKVVRTKKVTMTTEDFIKKAKEVHGDTYDYSDTVYTGSKDDVTIRCKHKTFTMRASRHLCGSGCRKCKREAK